MKKRSTEEGNALIEMKNMQTSEELPHGDKSSTCVASEGSISDS